MKVSYSTRLFLAWSLLFVGILVLVSGIFSLADNKRLSLALALVGLGLLGPAVWWLRRISRWSEGSKMRFPSAVGAISLVTGVLLMPWDSYFFSTDAHDHVEAERTSVSRDVGRASGGATSARSQPEMVETSESPAPTTVTSIQTMTVDPEEPVATVTAVETMVPPPVTVVKTIPLLTPQPEVRSYTVTESAEPSQPLHTGRVSTESAEPKPPAEEPEASSETQSPNGDVGLDVDPGPTLSIPPVVEVPNG